jgi:hypothetical protein
VQTGEGLFGTTLKFEDGLVLLRANNSMGKSTCIQAIIYALGLEKMLGPSSSIPLPHVMTRYVEEGNREIQALESQVLLEVENRAGEHLTIQRSVLGARDPRLVSTWDAPKLTNPSSPTLENVVNGRDTPFCQQLTRRNDWKKLGFLRIEMLLEFSRPEGQWGIWSKPPPPTFSPIWPANPSPTR